MSLILFVSSAEILANFLFKDLPKEELKAFAFNGPTQEAIQNETFLKDNLLLWRLRPSQNFTKKFTQDNFNGVYRINSLGLRGEDFLAEKRQEVFRVICLGDSVTFGWRVDFKDAYPKKLNDLLTQNFPQKNFEVVNAGILGYSSLQGVRFLKRDIFRLKPDLLVAYFGINDADKAVYFSDKYLSVKDDTIMKMDTFLKRFKSYRFLKDLLLKTIYRKRLPKEENSEHTRVSPKDYRMNMGELISLANKRNIPFVIIIPLVYENGFAQKLKNYDLSEFLNLAMTGKNIKYLNLLPAFSKFKNQKLMFFDNSHPTELGHSIIAKEIFRILVEEKLI